MKYIVIVVLMSVRLLCQDFTGLNTTTGTVALPSPVPCIGNSAECLAHSNSSFVGAGTILPETDFNPGKGLQYLRVTDLNTQPVVHSYHASTSGGSNQNFMSLDDTRFVLANSGGGSLVYSFDPIGFTATKLYGASYQLVTPNANWFSKITPKLWYTAMIVGGHPTIYAYDFTSTTTAPTLGNGAVTLVVDLATATGCPAITAATYTGELTLDDAEQNFSISVSTTGTADTAHYAIVWNRTNGCRYVDTTTATTGGNWGTNGTLNDTINSGSPAHYTIHESIISHDGNTLNITRSGCLTSVCSPNVEAFWTIANLNLTNVTLADGCGHGTMGYSHYVNKCALGSPTTPGNMTFFMRTLATPDLPNPAIKLNPNSILVDTQNDTHPGWPNDLTISDNVPVMTTAQSGTATCTKPYCNELIASRTDCYYTSCSGVNLFRLGHHYSDTSDTTSFYGQFAIPTVSAFPSNGSYYILFTSNWNQQLGCNDGTTYSSCGGVGGPRTDAFMFRVPSGGGTVSGQNGFQGVTMQGVTISH